MSQFVVYIKDIFSYYAKYMDLWCIVDVLCREPYIPQERD